MKTKEQVCEFAKHFEQAILGHTKEVTETLEALEQLKSWGIKINGLCVSPVACQLSKEAAQDLDCKNIVVIGYPYGDSTIRSKLADVSAVLDDDPDALIDYVPNFYDILFGYLEKTTIELQAIRAMVPNQLRLIVEVGKFTFLKKYKVLYDLISLAENCRFDVIKTSTGTYPNDLSAMERFTTIVDKTILPIKVSGGIKTVDDAVNLIEGGANFLGTSSAAKIIEEYMNS